MDERIYYILGKMDLTERTTIKSLLSNCVIDEWTARFCEINKFRNIRDLLLYYDLLGTFEFCPYAGGSETEQIMNVVHYAEDEALILVHVSSEDSAFIRTAYSRAMNYLNSCLNGAYHEAHEAKEEYCKAYSKLKAMRVVYERLQGDTEALKKERDSLRARIKRIQEKGNHFSASNLLTKLVKLENEIAEFEKSLR